MRTLLSLALISLCFSFSAQVDCPNTFDGNGDFHVTINDLIDLLSVFGDYDLDQDGVWDSADICVDPEACNYQANPTEPCGEIDALGVCGGSCPFDDNNDGYCDCSLDNVLLFDEVEYTLAHIGDQCWFASNLRSTVFSNGDPIPEVISNGDWLASANSAARCSVNNDTYLDEVFGYLYNSYTVNDSRNICPSGWRVPTDADWIVLELSLGMTDEVANLWDWRGSDQGLQLKSSEYWDGTNSSGFNAVPTGWRYHGNGGFQSFQVQTYFWSTSGIIYRQLQTDVDNINRGAYYPNSGYPVRCVRTE